jgi:hypothetical protein
MLNRIQCNMRRVSIQVKLRRCPIWVVWAEGRYVCGGSRAVCRTERGLKPDRKTKKLVSSPLRRRSMAEIASWLSLLESEARRMKWLVARFLAFVLPSIECAAPSRYCDTSSPPWVSGLNIDEYG